MYYLKIKSGIAIGLDYIKPEVGTYDCDEIAEVPNHIAPKLKLPCKLVDGAWVHTDEYPKIDYPPMPEPEPVPYQPTEIEKLESRVDYIAMMTGVEFND